MRPIQNSPRFIAILNPVADSGRTGKKRGAVEAAMRAAGLAGAVWLTEAPGHAVALARQAAREADAVLAVGGDGTVHEVSRGLIETGRPVPLGVIPLGTGNDFVKVIGMARDLKVAMRQIATATPSLIDYGLVRWQAEGGAYEQPFVNAVGVGFDARVAAEADAFKAWPGLSGYVAAVIRTLRGWEAPHTRISGAATPGGPATVRYEGKLLLVTAGNGVSSGGTFYLTPRACVTDGLLDVCMVDAISLLRLLRVLPRALRGRHEHEPEVHTARLATVRITADAGLPVHADGEVLTHQAHTIDIAVVPGGLPVLMPPSKGLRDRS